jgi:hypothetical protein
MNVEIGAEAAQFPEKEYINGIAVAVCGYSTFKDIIQLTPRGVIYAILFIIYFWSLPMATAPSKMASSSHHVA